MMTTVISWRREARVCRKGRGGVLHSILVPSLLLLSFVFGFGRASAQIWIPVGVPGGNVRELASDPRNPERVYLGTADGILYRSEDAGVTWKRLDPGFPRRGCSLDEIVVDRRGVVYVGFWDVHGRGGGIAWSPDRGSTFRFLKGMEGHSVRALAIAPKDHRTIAAAALDGVFLSRDAGVTWSRITPKDSPDLRNFGSIAFDPDDARVIYAGTWHLSWKTTDAGASWTRMDEGMIDDSDVMTLTLEPGNPQTVYATACTGIYRSADGGGRWTKLQGIPYSSRRTRAFALAGDDHRTLVAGTTQGLWISENRGESWRRATKKLVVNAVVTQPSGSILVGTEEDGVLRSKDGGNTWIASNTGFSERLVSKVLFDPRRNRVYMAAWGARGGVYVSSNVAGPWTRLADGLEGRQVLSLTLLGSTVLAGTDEGIFARGEDEEEWTPWATRVDGAELPFRATELVTLPDGVLLAATSQGVIRSFDAGGTWNRSSVGGGDEVFDLAVSPRNPNLVIAAMRSGFFRSKDGGESWKQISTGWGVTPHALVFMPPSDRVLYATTTGGLYRSKDQGATWKRVEGGVPHTDLTGIAIDPQSRAVYVSDFTWGGIFRSADNGATWERMPTDGLGSERVWSLTMDPSGPERLLAAASAGGLHLYLPRSRTHASGVAKTELAPVEGE